VVVGFFFSVFHFPQAFSSLKAETAGKQSTEERPKEIVGARELARNDSIGVTEKQA
jgi:hypothetical protein